MRFGDWYSTSLDGGSAENPLLAVSIKPAIGLLTHLRVDKPSNLFD
jgi:hypothetical protein